MTNFLKILSFIFFLGGLLLSCEVKNQFTEKESQKVIPSFTDKQLKFSVDLADYTKGEMTVLFGISGIKKEYKIDSFSLSLRDNKSEKEFDLLNIDTYDAGMGSNKREPKEFRDFNSAPSDRKIIDSTINIYYSIDHKFLVPNVNGTKNYRVDINAKFTTADSSYIIRKSFIFKRSKHFVPIRWTGC